jgi:beta-1,4-mannooligosaccharide/beta-1,4-mannosyl-N-acetylglucosamine phosphorylase
VVFPCAALVDREADRLTIYYGAADTVTCLAHGHLSEVLDSLRPTRLTRPSDRPDQDGHGGTS